MVEHAKLRIDTRLKLLARWNPSKYSEKQIHTAPDGVSAPIFEVRTRSILEDGGK